MRFKQRRTQHRKHSVTTRAPHVANPLEERGLPRWPTRPDAKPFLVPCITTALSARGAHDESFHARLGMRLPFEAFAERLATTAERGSAESVQLRNDSGGRTWPRGSSHGAW
eukprot:5273185-Pleurochrysis_carterae.AAC.1